MHVALFILYFLLLCFAITRLRFFKGQIRPACMLLFFGIHVAAGCMHNWIAYHFYPNHGDIWHFFEEGVRMKQILLTEPKAFLAPVFSDDGGFKVIDAGHPPLEIQYKIMELINVFLNLFSFNNIYINTLLFSFPVFAGSVALFKAFLKIYNKAIPALCALLLPSVLFWTSVLFKDGLFYIAIGYFLFYFLQDGGLTWRKNFLLLLCVLLMILSRANALITLSPAILFFILTEKKGLGKKWSVTIIVATVIIVVVFFNLFVPGGILHSISERQKDFQVMAGGSRIYLPTIEPSVSSLAGVFPIALFNGFFQPLPGAGGKSIYTLFSVELLITWAVILYSCFLLIKRKTIRLSNFDITCLLFALPGLVIIGYMIPFAGAIIRYRSIYFPFLLAPFLNILCSYPVKMVETINDWLCRNVIEIEPVKKL